MANVCSNCGKVLASREPKDGPGRAPGMCAECGELFRGQLRGLGLEKILEDCDCPSVVVNEQVRVVAYNQIYFLKFCRGEQKPAGLLAGEFLECRHSSSPGGCGKTTHCCDCAIRRAAVETLKTGKAQKNVRAQITQEEDERRVRRELMISTVKRGLMVQITVESFYTVLEPPSAVS